MPASTHVHQPASGKLGDIVAANGAPMMNFGIAMDYSATVTDMVVIDMSALIGNLAGHAAAQEKETIAVQEEIPEPPATMEDFEAIEIH